MYVLGRARVGPGNEKRRSASRGRLAALIVGFALMTVGCGEEESDPASDGPGFTGAPLEQQDPGAVHVHGLGYDETSGVLYIATHTGLFDLSPGAKRMRRVGDSRQDTMGFTLVEPGLFLGSGHPDLRENLPSHLGLIRSIDRGRSWQSVSLLGEADFHVLRAQGRTVYGFDSRSERLMASIDAGRSWKTRISPEALIDLAIDPKNPRHLLASGASALYESQDGGQTWTGVAVGLAGQLAWPTPGLAYLADLAGSFLSAPRPSGPWRSSGVLGAPAAALLAVDERTLFVALHDGTIVRSGNGGATWEVRATP